jgi:heat shock protein HtpX
MVVQERLNFDDEIAKNKIKSFFLMLIVLVVIIAIGYVVALILDPGYFFFVMIISIVFSIGYILVSYYNSDKIALASVKAQPASSVSHRQLLNAVENMSLASGLPMPKVYVMQSQEINAFASGRSPQKAVICVTTGALDKLNKQELEGVIAHEMGHIANFDIRFATLVAVMVGMVSIAAEIFLRSLWYSGGNDRDNKNAVLMIIGIVLAIVAPIVVQLVQLAISRKREYGADATGVKFTRYPKGLANALTKIKEEHVSNEELKRYPKAVAPLFISDPFKKKVQNLFSTHPDIDSRIERINAM